MASQSTSAGHPEEVFVVGGSEGMLSAPTPVGQVAPLPLVAALTQPVPTQGVRKVAWGLVRPVYTQTGWEWLRMEPSLKERHDVALERLWYLCDRQRIIAVANSKGGSGKTTVSTWLSVAIQIAIKRQVLALDANVNSGHTAKRLGIERENTIQLRDLIRKLNELGTYAELIQALGSHRDTGVGVIASDPMLIREFGLEAFEQTVRVVKSSCHTLVCDTGNGLLTPSNLGSINQAHVLVLPGLAPPPKRRRLKRDDRWRSNDSLDDLGHTMARYTLVGFGEKVRNALIVILGSRPEKRLEYADRYGLQPHQVHIIPPNDYMHDNYQVDLNRIPLDIQVALLELAVAIYETPLSNEQVDVRARIAALAEADELATLQEKGE